MLSTAAAGSVSDATKGSPTFSIIQVSVNPTDAAMSTVPPGVEVLSNGGSTSELQMTDLQSAGGFGMAILNLVASVGPSDAGGRAPDNPYIAFPRIVNDLPIPQVFQTNFDPADQTTNIGFFEPAGLNNGSEDSTTGVLDGSSITADSNPNLLLASFHQFMAPHVNSNPGSVTFASGVYEIPNNCITMRDLYTGVEAIGPTDGPFNFKIKLIP